MTKNFNTAGMVLNFEIAPDDEIYLYADIYEDFLLNIFGITDSLVTDRSTLADFATCCLPDMPKYNDMSNSDMISAAEEIMVKKIIDEYNIYVSPTMTLLEVCQLIDSLPKTKH